MEPKAFVQLIVISFVLGLAGACRTSNLDHGSDLTYVTKATDLGTIKAKTCVNYEKIPDCILRFKDYLAPNSLAEKAEKDIDATQIRDYDNEMKYPKTEEEAQVLKKLLEANQKDLRDVAEKMKGSLHPGEAKSIRYYTFAAYSRMNQALRGNAGYWESYKSIIYAAASALNKLTQNTIRGKVYRTESTSTRNLEMLKGVYQAGNHIVEETFLSTTRDANLNYAEPTPEQLWLSYTIHSKSGKHIQDISGVKEEDEVLFAPGTVFRVLSAIYKQVPAKTWGGSEGPVDTSKTTDAFLIELEEVDSI